VFSLVGYAIFVCSYELGVRSFFESPKLNGACLYGMKEREGCCCRVRESTVQPASDGSGEKEENGKE
jgi:hypothetical protein